MPALPDAETWTNAPPVIEDQVLSIAENPSAGTPIGTIAASDANSGQPRTFALVSCPRPCPLTLHKTTGELTVADAAVFNHEIVAAFDITVSATDALGAADSAIITIVVDDVNEPPSIALPNRIVFENLAGATVGPIVVEDEDGEDTHSIEVSDTRFEVVAGNLMLKRDQFLDAETEPQVEIQLTVTDWGDPPLSHAATFQISVWPNPFPWHNMALPQDINGDGAVTPSDAVLAINDINLNGIRKLGATPARPGQVAFFLDVVCDKTFTPTDIHRIVRFLNAAVARPAEGEDDPEEDDPLELIARDVESCWRDETASDRALRELLG
jgi:hypothetical protein